MTAPPVAWPRSSEAGPPLRPGRAPGDGSAPEQRSEEEAERGHAQDEQVHLRGRGVSREGRGFLGGAGLPWWGGASAGQGGASCGGAGVSRAGQGFPQQGLGRGGPSPVTAVLSRGQSPGPRPAPWPPAPRQRGRLTSREMTRALRARLPRTSANSLTWASPAATIHLTYWLVLGRSRDRTRAARTNCREAGHAQSGLPGPHHSAMQEDTEESPPQGNQACGLGVRGSSQGGAVLSTHCE